MFPILFMLAIITTAVSVLVIFYYKFIKISDNWARELEVFGYVLLFIVFIWEFIIKNILMENFYNSNWYYLDQRLKYMFLMMQANSGVGTIDKQHVINRFWEVTESEYVQTQIQCVNWVESILKILSTVFIAIGRFQEIKSARREDDISNG